MKLRSLAPVVLGSAAAVLVPAAHAADWSDTSIGFRTGSKFAEPFGRNDIHKNIVNLTHVSGWGWATNFFNVDLLNSDSKDANAQEAYVVYRFTADLGKLTGKDFSFGPVRSTGLTAGFDWNSKNDPGYASKKRMLVFGPTFGLNVPGFVNIGVYWLDESNKPIGIASRYSYKNHGMLNLVWGVPVPLVNGLSFEGYANWIAPKGKDEFGASTATETNIDAQIMYDVGAAAGMPKGKFKVGFEYQYWRNKFGNAYKGPAGNGALAKTPMIRAEYHF